MQDTNIPANAEVLHTHFQVRRRQADIGEFHARVQALRQRGLDRLAFCALHVRVVALAGDADAHGVVGAAELHHVDAFDRQDRIEVLDAFPLFDHHGDHHLIECGDIGGRAAIAHGADVAPHADAEPAAGAWGLGADGGDAGARILNRTEVGKQHALESRTDRAHGLVGPLRLLDLDHPRQVFQLQGSAEIVQVVHIEGRIFRGEFDIVVVAGLPDQFHQGRPG